MTQFIEFPKMARLSREIVITEKIDGTNAAVQIVELPSDVVMPCRSDGIDNPSACVGNLLLYAQSRTKIITPGKTSDNFGFAQWVADNAEELVKLGPGCHFGEWWGSGIQRGYGLPKGEKRFSLFNVSRWADDAVRPACCSVVPILYRGDFETETINGALKLLQVYGSTAAPGFMNPEGIVIYHTAANLCFKKTIHKDEVPKALAQAA